MGYAFAEFEALIQAARENGNRSVCGPQALLALAHRCIIAFSAVPKREVKKLMELSRQAAY